MEQSVTLDYAGRPLSIFTGMLAKQADGSVLVRYADTVVLVTAVADRKATENLSALKVFLWDTVRRVR
jgi:polyribonucleotide nucleotidyltransferase